jgi:hypothetical protein
MPENKRHPSVCTVAASHIASFSYRLSSRFAALLLVCLQLAVQPKRPSIRNSTSFVSRIRKN